MHTVGTRNCRQAQLGACCMVANNVARVHAMAVRLIHPSSHTHGLVPVSQLYSVRPQTTPPSHHPRAPCFPGCLLSIPARQVKVLAK